MKTLIEKWNSLCDILIEFDNPLLFGPRLSIFANIERTERRTIRNSLRKLNISKIFVYRYRSYNQEIIDFNKKEIYLLFSTSEAAFKQFKLFIDYSLANGKNVAIITNRNVLKYRNDYFTKLINVNVDYQIIESAPVWKNILKIIKCFFKSQSDLYLLNKKIKTCLGITLDKQKVFSFLYIDRLTFESGLFLFKNSMPNAIYSSSDMTGGYHAMHALANKYNIPNYVFQHGTLGILQTRHHPGTKVIVWGLRHKEYIDKITQGKDETIILNLHTKLFKQNVINLSNKQKNSIKKRIVFISNGLYTANNFYTQMYVDSTFDVIRKLSEDQRFEIFIKLHPSENEYFIKRIIEKDNIKLITDKMSVSELAAYSYVCFSNYSTVSQEMLHFNTVSLIYHPINYVSDPDFVGICMPECEFNDQASFLKEMNNLCDSNYYDKRLSIQTKILPLIFDQTLYD